MTERTDRDVDQDYDPKGAYGGSTGDTDQLGKGVQAEKGDQRREDKYHDGPQTGTVDAMRGTEPDAFGAILTEGVEKIQAAGADGILMNMQYSPRTETMIAVGPYVENMRWAAQQGGVPVFDRLGIMRHWSDTRTFDLYAATKDFAVAQKVHECIGRALAAQIIDAAHLGPMTSKVLPQ